jgi:CubicO group peptidase (beta-lactamase class C family)
MTEACQRQAIVRPRSIFPAGSPPRRLSHRTAGIMPIRRAIRGMLCWRSLGAPALGAQQVRMPTDAGLLRVRRSLLERVERGAVASLALSVRAGDSLIWEEGMGLADKTRRIPATPRTLYGVGSVTKQMVAEAALALSGEGQLNLDAPAATYLAPDELIAREGDPATVRQLLDHRGGVGHGRVYYDRASPPPWLTGRRMIQLFGVQDFAPGGRGSIPTSRSDSSARFLSG